MRELGELKIYLKERLKMRKPMILADQIEVYDKTGIFTEGHNGQNFPSFKQWERIKHIKFNYEKTI